MSTYHHFSRDLVDSGRTTEGGIFGKTMGFVALTIGCFTLGAYLGRNISVGWSWVAFIASFALLIGMRFSVRSSTSSTIGLLLAFGLILGFATGPVVAYYARSDPATVSEAAGATALFMAGLGSAGYATRRDLTKLSRAAFWALLGLILFGIVSIFIQIPGSSLAYSVLGLVIFAVLVVVDFQRLRRRSTVESAPLLAASIFIDFVNVLLFFLNLFSGRRKE